MSGRQAESLDLLGGDVEFADGALIHHPEPDIAVLVRVEAERALRPALLELGQIDLGDLAGLGIHPADVLLAEVGVPDVAVLADDHVVGLDGIARQIVFGDDHLGGPPGRPRQCLERVSPGGGFAQIDRGQKFGAILLGLVACIAAFLEQPFGHALLRPRRHALIGVGAHALLNLHEFVGIMGRPHDALDGVAAHAVEHGILLLRRARHALQPFGRGELARQIVRLLELEVGGDRLLGDDLRRALAVEIISGRADLDGIFAGLEPRCREAVAAFLVGDDGGCDGRARLLGGDEDALHRAFLVGCDLAGQRRGALGQRQVYVGNQYEGETDAREQRIAHPHIENPPTEMFGGPHLLGKPAGEPSPGKLATAGLIVPFDHCDNRTGRAASQSRSGSRRGQISHQCRSAARRGRLNAQIVTPAANAMAAIITKKAGLCIEDQKLPR